jgi:methionine synthase I (cobalamin-dependent)
MTRTRLQTVYGTNCHHGYKQYMVQIVTMVTNSIWYKLTPWLQTIYGTNCHHGYKQYMVQIITIVTNNIWYKLSPWLQTIYGTNCHHSVPLDGRLNCHKLVRR